MYSIKLIKEFNNAKMKTKNLLFTGATALLLASCSQTDLEQFDATPSVEGGKGVTFATSINEGAETRAAYEAGVAGAFNHNWYADKDKIGVLFKAGTKVSVYSGQAGKEISGDGWMGLASSAESHSFEFKATASGTKGYFVANGDNNTLWLDVPGDPVKGYTEAEMPVFRAYWPLESSRMDFANSSKINISAYASATQTQTTTDGHSIAENAFMVSESDTKSTYDANDNSVAKDRFNLNFTRISPIVYFKIKTGGADNAALNREYERDYAKGLFKRFGNLKEVVLEAEGSQKTGSSLAPSKLTFNSGATWDMAAKNVYDPKEAFDAGNIDDAVSTITTTLGGGSGLEWSNDAVAFMVIANVDRSAYSKKGETEKVTATYTFEKIQLQTSKETANSWISTPTNPLWVGFPYQEGYDLDNEPYIAYEYGTGAYALEVNPAFKGKLADLFETNGDLKGIAKADGSAIAKTEIKHFVSKVNITTAADFDVINTLTALTNITLLENTVIPAKAFTALDKLVYINLPKVTTIADVNAFHKNANFAEVYMGSYDFSDKAGTNQTAVRDFLLKAANLTKADISAVAYINAGFPTSGVTFTDFTQLTEITVKPGVVVGGAAFKGCSTLATVQFPKGATGASVNLDEGANSQFMNCVALKAINISNTVIPAMAFNGCSILEEVNGSNGKAIVPTAIGISSFEGCALEDMDLSKAETIGAAAFKGCTALKGNNKKNSARTVLYVNAVTHVSDYAFENCSKLEYISFANATTIGVDILKGTSCKEIEFLKAFTVNSNQKSTDATQFFGTTTSTKLFCANGQTGVNVNSITLASNASGSKPVTTEFGNGIVKYAQ